MITTIIFDFSSVLTITTERHLLIRRFADELKLSYDDLRKILYGGDSWSATITGKISVDDYINQVLDILSLPRDHDIRILKDPFINDPINQEMIALVKKAKQVFKTVLLSNSTISLRKKLEQEGLIDLFDEIIISAEVGLRKPDIHIYQLALQGTSSLPEECIYIDDKEKYLNPAKTLGINTILFSSFRLLVEEFEKYNLLIELLT